MIREPIKAREEAIKLRMLGIKTFEEPAIPLKKNIILLTELFNSLNEIKKMVKETSYNNDVDDYNFTN